VRIGLIGQAAFGEAVFQALRQRGDEIAGVFAPPSAPNRRPDPLVSVAQAAGVPVFQPRRLRDPEAETQMRGLGTDLGVMAFVTSIAPATFLAVPRLGTIQYHPSLLPRHRGGSAINWAVIQGETRTGLSIFWPDGGIDTGPILLQKETEIGPDDTTGSLYFDKLFPLGVQAMVEAVALVEANRAPRIPQDETAASYDPLCTSERCRIDWNQPGHVIYNLVRGADPQPGAVTVFRGAGLRFFSAAMRDKPAPDGAPGEVLAVVAGGILVATAGSPILVKRVQAEGSAKQAATDWAEAAKLRPGDRFGV
jgi:methionyl-tRNA formyltransferase